MSFDFIFSMLKQLEKKKKVSPNVKQSDLPIGAQVHLVEASHKHHHSHVNSGILLHTCKKHHKIISRIFFKSLVCTCAEIQPTVSAHETQTWQSTLSYHFCIIKPLFIHMGGSWRFGIPPCSTEERINTVFNPQSSVTNLQ